MTHKKGTVPTPENGTPHETNSAIVAQPGAIAKRFHTLRAELALAGFECRECVEGGYFVTRWNLTKYCRDLADLEAFVMEVRK
ncbi:hypothetical protein [Aquabacterium sp. A08]|uniref:hypothetical protein n=1 Tax=Aquabacterium sp. A08 TaxID=2718532 RepID=UPI00141DBC1D|nr:hypothetical protein [Aquabacterium sp. A08]NIC43314.1 hypothetical protein [Aquabacterium sp. A08]